MKKKSNKLRKLSPGTISRIYTVFEHFSYQKKIFSIGTVFGLIGLFFGIVLFFVFDSQHIAAGSYLITRELESKPSLQNNIGYQPIVEDFNGYYAQKNSEGITASLIGALEQDSVGARVLGKFSEDVTYLSLKRLKVQTKIKKAAPQIISIKVSANSAQLSKQIFSGYEAELRAIVSNLNAESSENLLVLSLGESPLTYKNINSIWLNAFLGFVSGFALSGSLAVLMLPLPSIPINSPKNLDKKKYV